MSTQFTNRQWRLPNNENKDKQSNYSMDFDGSSYIDAGTGLGDSLGGSYSGDLTVSMWLKFDSTSTQYGLFYIGDLAGGGGSFWINTSASKLWVYANNGNAGYINCSISSLNTTDWYNVICVYKGYDISNSKIYINNVSQTLTTSGNFNYTYDFTSKKTAIGDYYTTPPFRGFNGQIDAVSIFDYALSASQITTLYGSSSTGIGNPMAISGGGKPVAFYPLGDQDAFNGADYLVPNSSLKDFVFDFNPSGSGDYISFGNDTSLKPTSNYTFSIWFKGDSSSYALFGTNSSTSSGVHALLTSTNIIYYHKTTGSLVQFNNGVGLNSWHNFTITWSASTGILRGFIDGKYAQQATGVNDIVWGNELEVGRYNGGQFKYDGKLSNFAMWDTALTDGFSGTPSSGDLAGGQVAEVYNNGSPQTTITGTPVGWWKLDASATYDGSDWTIADSSSNSNDGTSSGMTQSALQQSDLSFKTSYSPYALDFDGTTYQRVEIPNYQNNFPSNQIFTISTWVRINSASNYCFWGIDGTGDNALYTYVTNGTGLQIRKGNTTSSNIPNVLTIGEWANVVAVFDSTINCKLYINNVFIQDITTASLNTTNTNDFFIGAGINQYYVLDHSQSNLSIWNAALTPAQVSEIYSEGVPQNLNNHSAYSNLTNWWQLGSNSSYTNKWICLDEKGTNNGESVNMTEDDIIDGVNSYANGLSSGMSDNIVGSAPFSDANSLSVNMDVEDRTTDTPS